jgi:hypothetical protein
VNARQDPIDRCALLLARYVNATGRISRAAARRRLPAVDRPHFIEALTLALITAMVREDGDHHLIPGHFNPDPFAEARPPHCRTCTCIPSDAPLSS